MRRLTSVVSAAVFALAFSATANAADLVKYKVTKNGMINASLTGKPGDAEAGKKVFTDRKLGNCLACHHVTALNKEAFHGNIGPALDGVADRMKAGEIRLRIVNPKKANPDTIMPAFYKADGLHRVKKEFVGKTILTAQQIEDLVAYVMTLK